MRREGQFSQRWSLIFKVLYYIPEDSDKGGSAVYHFIANSRSYLNTAGFSDNFSVPVISWIESIGGGWLGGVWGSQGGWGGKGGLKQPFGLKQQSHAFII